MWVCPGRRKRAPGLGVVWVCPGRRKRAPGLGVVWVCPGCCKGARGRGVVWMCPHPLENILVQVWKVMVALAMTAIFHLFFVEGDGCLQGWQGAGMKMED